jgi:murein DD-endopeptidase MepM/ murein hydrolase activator NlpD
MARDLSVVESDASFAVGWGMVRVVRRPIRVAQNCRRLPRGRRLPQAFAAWRHWMATAGLFLIAILMAGCAARTGAPAPVVDGSSSTARAGMIATGTARAAATPPARGGLVVSDPGTLTVQPGENLYGLARRTNAPIRALIDANGLTPPYQLQAGRTLVVPAVRQHIVQTGDTLYAVSRRYDVDVSTLARTNGLQPPYVIRTGTGLILPAELQTVPITAVAAASPPPANVPVSSAPLPAAVSPGLVPPPSVPPAGSAWVPPGAAPGPVVSEPALPAPATRPPIATTSPANTLPVPEPAIVANAGNSVASTLAPPPDPSPAVLEPPAVAKPPVEIPSEAAPATAAMVVPGRGGRFLWPVRGRVLGTFGPGEGGTHNDGINIAAPAGTPVVAAENGVVAYAGNELRGFGNLLLIKHPDGWVTAYAHNDALLVKKGDQVRRGQPIARVGRTGSVTEPQLHFEARKGTRAVDPTEVLPVLTSGVQPASAG